MKMNKSLLTGLGSVAAAVIRGIIGWFLLPEQVGVQVDFSGQLQNYIPKPAALLLPVALGALGTVFTRKEERSNMGLMVAMLAPVLMVFILFTNL